MTALLTGPASSAPLDSVRLEAVQLEECGEPLVPVPSAVTWESERPLVRSGVAARLAVAQLLLPPGRRLLVVDGHRPPRREPARSDAHGAGAAVDVTLVDRGARQVRMGPRSAGAAQVEVPAAVRGERDLLARAMCGAGFVGDPEAWWHWSHGDEAWARSARRVPVYGPIAVVPRLLRSA